MAELHNFLSQLQAWHWLSLGIILIAIDSLLTGGFLLGAAIAALCVWLVKLTVPGISWQMQIILFSVLAIVCTVLYNRIFNQYNQETDAPLINNRAAQLVGREIILEQALDMGQNKLQIGDTYWKAITQSAIAKGAKVRVNGYTEQTLHIEEVS